MKPFYIKVIRLLKTRLKLVIYSVCIFSAWLSIKCYGFDHLTCFGLTRALKKYYSLFLLTGIWRRQCCRLQGTSVLSQQFRLSKLEQEEGWALGNLWKVWPASLDSGEPSGKCCQSWAMGLGLLDWRHTSTQCVVTDQGAAVVRAYCHLQTHPQVS